MTLNPPQDFRSTDKTHRSGLAADKPAAADVLLGTLYFSTDTATLERSDGSTWSSYSGGGGAPGPQGPTGKQGSQGLFGHDGQDGSDGYDGFNGTPGPAGLTGPRGTDGISIQGMDGFDGDIGEQGYPGPIGSTGNQGPAGLNGSIGLNGPSGFDGEDGLEGFPLPGPPGNIGLQGIQGIPGANGGSSAPTLVSPFITEAEEAIESPPLFPSIIIPATPLQLFNSETTTPGAGFASDTYLAGSRILIPPTYPRVGTRYRLIISASKTGAGVAAAAFTVRYGTAGAIGDTSRLVFTFGIQTAAIDTGTFELFVHFRVSGSSAIIAGVARCLHHLAATGLTTTGAAGNGIIIPAVPAAFDATPVNSFIGVSLNAGSLAAWTIVIVEASLEG